MAQSIEVTVKTLDSRTHSFTVLEDMTVKDFKDHISPTIGISTEQQRLIFRGRVLQDENKLNEYNIANSTIHVVQRPANAASNRSNDQPAPRTSNNDQGGSINVNVGGGGGGPIIMGAIGIPTIDFQTDGGNHGGITAVSRRNRNSASFRLQVGNQMLGRASALLRRLEEDNSVTHAALLAEAAAADPNNTNPPVDEGSEGNRGDLGGAQSPMEMDLDLDDQNTFGRMISQVANAASTAALVAAIRQVPPGAPAPAASGAGMGTAWAGPGPVPVPNNNTASPGSQQPEATPAAANAPRPEAPRLREMANEIQNILAFHDRLTPYLHFLQSNLQANRLYENPEDLQSNQYVFDTMSTIMHYLSHSYHALSDIMCDFATPPDTRRLRAPASILVEQSTVVRATIPVQTAMLAGNNPTGMQQPQGQPLHNPPNGTSIPGATNNAPQANQQIPMNFSSFNPGQINISQGGGFNIPDLSAILGPALAGGMMPMFMNANIQTGRLPGGNSGPNQGINVPFNPFNFQVPRFPNQAAPAGTGTTPAAPTGSTPATGTGTGIPITGVPGGVNSPNNFQQQLRNEFSRPPFDILLSCHSHHNSGRQQAVNRPTNFRQFVNVADSSTPRNRSPSEDFLLNCIEFLQQSELLNLLRPVFQNVIVNNLLRGQSSPTPEQILESARTLALQLVPFLESVTSKIPKGNSNVNLSETYLNLISKFLNDIFRKTLSAESEYNFEIIQTCDNFIRDLVGTLKICFPTNSDGHIQAALLKAVIDMVLKGTSLVFRENATKNINDYLSTLLRTENPSASSNIVYKEKTQETTTNLDSQSSSGQSSTLNNSSNISTTAATVDPRSFPVQSMDEDIDDLLNLSIPRPPRVSAPIAEVNSIDSVLRNIPTEWVDTVRHDIGRQMGMPDQPPFSPGYVALLSSRKP